VQGPERVFRFKGIKASDGNVSPTHYANDLNNPAPSQHISKQTGQRGANVMPDAVSITGTQPHATANTEAEAEAAARSSCNPPAQSRGRKFVKGRTKGKQPHQRSMAGQAPNSGPPDSLQIMDTMQSNYVQVNQMIMDMLCIAGVTQPQPINGPGDGEPEYLIPQHIYVRYLTPTSLVHDNVNDAPCPIDPSLLEDNSTTPPQDRSHGLRPHPLMVCLAVVGLAVVRSAMVRLAAVGSATVGLEMVGSAMVRLAAVVIGLATVGSEMVGLEVVRSATVSLAKVGLAMVGLATVGLAAVELATARPGNSGEDMGHTFLEGPTPAQNTY